jgi:hypothetical protein
VLHCRTVSHAAVGDGWQEVQRVGSAATRFESCRTVSLSALSMRQAATR